MYLISILKRSVLVQTLSDWQKLFACIALLISIFTPSHSQDLKQVLEKMHRQYQHATKLHVVMKIAVFVDTVGTKPFYSDKAEIKKDGMNYYYSLNTNEMLMNDNYLVVVDKESKEILLSRRDKKAEMSEENIFKMTLDSALNFYDETKYVGKNGNTEHFRLVPKAGQIKLIDLFINNQTNLLEKIEYYYEEGQHAVIEFSMFSVAPVFEAKEFSENRYIREVNGKWIPGSEYKMYKISAP